MNKKGDQTWFLPNWFAFNHAQNKTKQRNKNKNKKPRTDQCNVCGYLPYSNYSINVVLLRF